MIKFAVISPHAPILLPDIGSPADRKQVNKTIMALESLNKACESQEIDEIIISSPHPDWGFDVPLQMIASEFGGKITKILTDAKSPLEYFQLGQEYFQNLDKNKNYAIIASGDLSHVLKEDGPYGFHPDGPVFDKNLIERLQTKDFVKLFELENEYPQAGDCGMGSFAFALGILKASNIKLNIEILSYEGPFGVGYLVARLV